MLQDGCFLQYWISRFSCSALKNVSCLVCLVSGSEPWSLTLEGPAFQLLSQLQDTVIIGWQL